MKFGRGFFQTKLLTRLSLKVCRLLSSPVLLRKSTINAINASLFVMELEKLLVNGLPSLRHRSNLTPVSNVCKAEPISLFWAPNGLNESPEMRFEFPFNLIGKN